MNALVLVDLQYDFLPGGALAVPDGDAVIPFANAAAASPLFRTVVATQDWHPPDHGSFAASHPGRRVGDVIELDGLPQILWPIHCVQGTQGAALTSALQRERVEKVFPKGTDARVDSYSGFFDNGRRRATGLGDHLRERAVTRVFVLGLATDYCVKFTALDARRLGFSVVVLAEGCRAVNVHRGDDERAFAELRADGVCVVEHWDELRG